MPEVVEPKVYRVPGKRGAGANTRRGIEVALSHGSDVIVTLDGDGQHDPREIPRLVKPIEDGVADVVVGSRFLSSGYRIPKYRKFGIDVITFALNVMSRTKFTDGQCCFRAYSRKALEAITITEAGFGFSTEILIKARALGFRIVEVPVSCIYHEDIKSNSTLNPVRHGLGVLLVTIRWRIWETFQKQ